MAIEHYKIQPGEMHALRAADVTASVAAALFGRHRYVTPLQLHLMKRGVEFPAPDSRVLRRGHWLETAVATAVAEKRPEWTIEKANDYWRNADWKLGATPDFYIRGDARGFGILQAKTVAPSVFVRDWINGEEAPFDVVVQTLVEMMLTDAPFGYIAALVVDPFDMDVHLIEVPRHAAAEARIVEAADRFWQDVAAGREPAADFTRDSEAIRALTRRELAGKTFDGSGNNELPVILAQRAALLARIKDDEVRCTEIENEVKLLLGDAEVVSNLAGWRITFKTTMRAAYKVEAKSTRTLRIYDRRPAIDRPEGTDDDVAA